MTRSLARASLTRRSIAATIARRVAWRSIRGVMSAMPARRSARSMSRASATAPLRPPLRGVVVDADHQGTHLAAARRAQAARGERRSDAKRSGEREGRREAERACSVPSESEHALVLLCACSGRRTGVHFAGTCACLRMFWSANRRPLRRNMRLSCLRMFWSANRRPLRRNMRWLPTGASQGSVRRHSTRRLSAQMSWRESPPASSILSGSVLPRGRILIVTVTPFSARNFATAFARRSDRPML